MKEEGLTVVGIGIHHATQITSAALAWIESADFLFEERNRPKPWCSLRWDRRPWTTT